MTERAASLEDGFTVLELLIAIAILAMVATIAGSIRFPTVRRDDAKQTFTSFIDRGRIDTMQGGQPRLLTIDDQRASLGSASMGWSDSDMVVSASPASNDDVIRLVIFPDGTVQGPHLSMIIAGQSVPLQLIYRPWP